MPRQTLSQDKELVALGQVVRDLRYERGMTQEDLAHRISLTVGQISKIERGQANPRWWTVLKLAEGLEVTPAEFAAKAEVAARELNGGPAR